MTYPLGFDDLSTLFTHMRAHVQEDALAVTEKTMIEYFSQDTQTCGAFEGKACAVVSLANALRRLVPAALNPPTPLDIIKKCEKNDLFDFGGLSPMNLHALCRIYLLSFPGLSVEYITSPTARAKDLAPGALMYVRSLALLNAQGGDQCPTSENEKDSHVVFVESISEDGTVMVINPDRALKESASGFVKSQWGRMKIPQACLESVWKSVRFDGTKTTRCAICLVI